MAVLLPELLFTPELYGCTAMVLPTRCGCRPWPLLLLLLPELLLAAPADMAPPAPEHLRVEGLLEPVAVISEPLPRFSFLHGEAAAAGFGVTQTSYRIRVADADSGTPLWDSGDVKSPDCSQIVYGGKPLAPFRRFAWSVDWTHRLASKVPRRVLASRLGRCNRLTGKALAG